MDKEENYLQGNFPGLGYPVDHHQLMKPGIGETYGDSSNPIADYTLTNHPRSSTSPEKLSFADVMQFADFGPKLALNQTKISEEEEEEEEEAGIDPVYFLRFPVLNEDRFKGLSEEQGGEERGDGEGRGISENNNNNNNNNNNSAVGIGIVGGNFEKNLGSEVSNKNKRKRARSVKTSEEVESQRMTHIAVERNRRKQMNEHLRVLRSLMPGSYVQRGDQASIIGGAIEFVRELEQLLQCLESQRRRRLYGDPPPPPRPLADSSTSSSSLAIPQPPHHQPPPFFPPPLLPSDNNQLKLVDHFDITGVREETGESKSCLADVEVKMLGFDAMIKILSRRRPGQLIKTIAALEDLQLTILHTNITTIEQTVLYSFNVKVTSEARFSAEDIASSVQQIFSFIHANS